VSDYTASRYLVGLGRPRKSGAMIDGVSYCTLCDTRRWVGWPLVSCLVMAPPVTRRAHSMRRLSGAELGTDTDHNDTRTDTLRDRQDSNGPGSTGDRSQHRYTRIQTHIHGTTIRSKPRTSTLGFGHAAADTHSSQWNKACSRRAPSPPPERKHTSLGVSNPSLFRQRLGA